jgi:hypothetical protein
MVNKKRRIAFKDGDIWKTYYIKPDGSYKVEKVGTYRQVYDKVKHNARFDKLTDILPARGDKTDRLERITKHNADINYVKKIIRTLPKQKDIKVTKKEGKGLNKKEIKELQKEKYNKLIDQTLTRAKRVNMQDDVLKVVNKGKRIKRKSSESGRQFVIFHDVSITYQYGTSPRLYVGSKIKVHMGAIENILENLKYFSVSIKCAEGEIKTEFFKHELSFVASTEKKLDIISDRLAERALRIWGKERIDTNATIEFKELL